MEAIRALSGTGATLSLVLFDFASKIGSAGQEIRQIGIEISIFCSVLEQLQSTLTKAKAYRYSVGALETTQEILNRCQEVFDEIEGIISGLRKRGQESSPEAIKDLRVRVKWTFKRSRVQVLRTTLESCKLTLHMMLSTLDFAQKIATRRTSTLQTQAEDEHEETMTRSLVIAHQCTVDALHKLEEEEVQQQAIEGDPMSSQLIPGTPPLGQVVRAPAGHNSSQPFNTQKVRSPIYARNPEKRRASVWINSLIFDDSPLPPGFRRQTWCDAECALFLDQQPYYFLQKWTDQGDHLKELRRQNIEDLAERDTQEISTNGNDDGTIILPTELLLHSAANTPTEQLQKFSTSGGSLGPSQATTITYPIPLNRGGSGSVIDKRFSNQIEIDRDLDLGYNSVTEHQISAITKYNLEGPLGLRNELQWPLARLRPEWEQPIRPRLKTPDIITMPQEDQTSSTRKKLTGSEAGSGLEIFKSFRVSMEDPCYKVLPAALKKWNINDPWKQYVLYIVYGENERCLGMDEKPLMIFKQLDKEGKKPMFMLRKLRAETVYIE